MVERYKIYFWSMVTDDEGEWARYADLAAACARADEAEKKLAQRNAMHEAAVALAEAWDRWDRAEQAIGDALQSTGTLSDVHGDTLMAEWATASNDLFVQGTLYRAAKEAGDGLARNSLT